jgi:putative ABC transport system permease protein
VGDALLVGNLPVIVAGVMAPKGRLLTDGTGLSALDYDHALILPVSTMSAMSHSLHGRGFDGMVIALQENWAESIVSFGEQLQRILGEAHRRVNDFTVLVPVTLLRQVQESQRMFSLVMGAIAGLSLLVGGIGVMNVMLANIAEQTREIGLRMAIGASRRRIVQLYLCHSVILTAGGGAWGLGGGILLALIIEHYAGWQVGFSSISLVLAPASAIVTGVLFGVHPALQAARLQPAAALRET